MNSDVNSSTASRVQILAVTNSDLSGRKIKSLPYVVAVLVGLVLLAAGMLKLCSLAPGLEFGRSIINRAWWLFALSIIEISLGIWLLTGVRPRWTWGIAILFFIGTTAYGAWMLLRGQTTCPCFGDYPSPTALTFGISIMCLSALLVFRTRFADLTNSQSWLTPTFILSVVGSAFCAIAIIDGVLIGRGSGGILRFVDTKLATVQIVSAPLPVDFFGDLSAKIPLIVTNQSAFKSITVIGMTHGCGAIGDIMDLPKMVQPNESKTLWLTVSRPGITNEQERIVVSAHIAGTLPFDPTTSVVYPIEILVTDGVGPVQRIKAAATLEPSALFLDRFDKVCESIKNENSQL